MHRLPPSLPYGEVDSYILPFKVLHRQFHKPFYHSLLAPWLTSQVGTCSSAAGPEERTWKDSVKRRNYHGEEKRAFLEPERVILHGQVSLERIHS